VAGAVASITVAAPLDTIKTRIQNANFEHKVHGLTVVRDLVRTEGPTAFFKGLTPKVTRDVMFRFIHFLYHCFLDRFWSSAQSWCSAIRLRSRLSPFLGSIFDEGGIGYPF
jgi:hypothetical protein